MGRIRVMDNQLSNMIAAGEVVERPASVVKELVENAIDAGARRVDVEIEEGGIQAIRVKDDGCGMDREDCLNAFERHATSKITTTRDLFQIRTLGFRGEALPSIASVAKVELRSSEASDQLGTKVVVEGGQVRDVTAVAGVKGTEVVVRDLFYNTPARLKYLKSIATEVAHISDYLNRLALAKADTAFTLTHNGKTILQTNGDGKLLHVIAAIYGVQVARRMVSLSGESLDFRWNGFISSTEVTRANRSYISLFINGRYIRSHTLNLAVLRGYHTLLPTGRYPVVVLHLEMDPALVDVNVHPAKLEVRISKEQELCERIEQEIKRTLKEKLTIVQPFKMAQQSRQPKQVVQPRLSFDTAYTAQRSRPLAVGRIRETLAALAPQSPQRLDKTPPSPTPAPPAVSSNDPMASVEGAVANDEPAILDGETGAHESAPGLATTRNGQGGPARSAAEALPAEVEPSAAQTSPDSQAQRGGQGVPELYPVGQVHGTYIVAQNDTGMYLIDQHAAQERIFYEYFMDKLLTENQASQLLLFPHTVECTAGEEELLKQRLPLLASWGLEIEWFGSRTFLVRAHPQWFPAGSEREVIDELIRLVLDSGETVSFDPRVVREKAAIMMACKAAIKANRYLTHGEMEALLERLRQTSSPFTCPHGRPIIVHFTTYDLQKMFKRVM